MRVEAPQFKLAALAIILLTVATRLPALFHPQPIDDEAPYSVVANEIVEGGRPYIDAVDRKPPLLFWTYAAVFEAAGKFNWKALHSVALLWVLATMAGLYVIGRELFDQSTGLIAALLYSVFQPFASWKNLAFNGEVLMNLPLVWAWAIACRRSSSPVRPELFIAGALLCAAFLLKQPAAIAAVPLGIYLLLPSYRMSRGLVLMNCVTHAAMLTAGFFSTLALVAIVLKQQGILGEAFYWTITNHAVAHVFWSKGILSTLGFVGACLPLLIGAVLAIRNRSGIWVGKGAERTALFGLLGASAIGAAAGARFYPHYYIQLLPPLILMAAPYYARLWSERLEASHWLLRPAVTYGWLALTVLAFSISHWSGLASRRAPTEAGKYLFEHSAPEERIFVWGHNPAIYLDAQRRPASRYILTFPLTGYVFGGRWTNVDTSKWIMPGAWATLEKDFARHAPTYIIDVQSDSDARHPIKNFAALEKLLAERYQPVAKVAEGVLYRVREARAFQR